MLELFIHYTGRWRKFPVKTSTLISALNMEDSDYFVLSWNSDVFLAYYETHRNRNILLCWRKPTKTTFPINWIFGILLVPSSYVWHDGHSESYLVSVSVTIMMDHQPPLRQTQAGLWRRSRMEYPPTLSLCPPIITQISSDHFARNVSNISLESRATSQQPAGKGNICAYSQSFC